MPQNPKEKRSLHPPHGRRVRESCGSATFADHMHARLAPAPLPWRPWGANRYGPGPAPGRLAPGRLAPGRWCPSAMY
jgi:hypothetical protein